MAEVKLWKQRLDNNGGMDPWSASRPAATPSPDAGTNVGAGSLDPYHFASSSLPLVLGPLGGLATGKLYDDKLTTQDGYRFDGIKGGDQWRGKLRRYFMSKCPALKALLQWCETADDVVITRPLLLRAVSGSMSEEQLDVINSTLWGFISGCVSSEAETVFKRAEELNGLDAWRRICRYIDHGRGIRLEALRAEVRAIHLRPMKGLENVALGVAEFENKLKEYEEAGGKQTDGHEKKADLLAILPQELRENLLGRAADDGPYEQFRDMVQAQAAKILLTRRKLPVHNIEDEELDTKMKALDEMIAAIRSGNNEDLLGAFNRATGRPGQTQRRPNGQFQRQTQPTSQSQRSQPSAGLGPRCPNCGDRHLIAKCPKPIVAADKRKCWNCGTPGCIASRCDKPRQTGSQQRGLKALEDGPLDGPLPMFCLNEIGSDESMCINGLNAQKDNHDGYEPVRHGARPRPHEAVLGDFIAK